VKGHLLDEELVERLPLDVTGPDQGIPTIPELELWAQGDS
jgi:hypothetical protein